MTSSSNDRIIATIPTFTSFHENLYKFKIIPRYTNASISCKRLERLPVFFNSIGLPISINVARFGKMQISDVLNEIIEDLSNEVNDQQVLKIYETVKTGILSNNLGILTMYMQTMDVTKLDLDAPDSLNAIFQYMGCNLALNKDDVNIPKEYILTSYIQYCLLALIYLYIIKDAILPESVTALLFETEAIRDAMLVQLTIVGLTDKINTDFWVDEKLNPTINRIKYEFSVKCDAYKRVLANKARPGDAELIQSFISERNWEYLSLYPSILYDALTQKDRANKMFVSVLACFNIKPNNVLEEIEQALREQTANWTKEIIYQPTLAETLYKIVQQVNLDNLQF